MCAASHTSSVANAHGDDQFAYPGHPMPVSTSTRFVSGAARFRDLLYIVAKDRTLAADDVCHSRFIGFDRAQLSTMGDRDWECTAVCVAMKPSEKFVAIGDEGQVFTYVSGRVVDETIPTEGPVVLRNASTLDGFPVVCGMKGRVFLRTDEQTWVANHAPVDPTTQEAPDFEAIAGFSREDAYAVGRNGAIFRCSGSSWTRCASTEDLTEVVLTGVACAKDGVVYVTGQNGTLLRGTSVAPFERVPLDGVTDDLWDCRWFEDRLFVSSLTGLFTLAGTKLERVDVPGARTFRRLSESEGVLWTIGADDVFCLDGTWARVDP